jgi:hypothetical protein
MTRWERKDEINNIFERFTDYSSSDNECIPTTELLTNNLFS